MADVIRQLCREYTDLSEEEIQVIEMVAGTLQPMANLEAADMFVDCPCPEGDAIVIAEAKPEESPSSYKNSVVGMLAKAENEPAVARTLKLGIATKHMRARTQEDNYTIQSVEPIKYQSRVIGVLIRERRITENTDDEREERAPVGVPVNHMMKEDGWLAESIDEGLLLVDAQGTVTFRNMYARELFRTLGYSVDILGQKYKNICPIRYEGGDELEEVLTEAQVGKYYLRLRQIPLEKDGTRLAVTIRDVTRNREQEKNLMLKSTVIRELHHRVKNNLQMMASLLRLQARRAENEETRNALNESIDRILSMSVTHQILCQNGTEDINLREVLEAVKNNALELLCVPEHKVEAELIGDDIIVDSEIASASAMAVNELLVNSMKYAFEGREKGKIQILLEKGKVYSTVAVVDDGVGFDPSKCENNSLGLNLVQKMVKDKLHGNLKIRSSGEGTKVMFDFINESADLVSVSE